LSDPRFLSPRKTHRTYGWRVTNLAEKLDRPLLPWQRTAADLMGEHDVAGNHTNSLVVLTCPRRAGKSELLMLRQIDRCLFIPNQRCWITAQSGSMARERWTEFTDWIMTTALGPRLRVKHSTGAERMTFPNGSTFRPFTPSATSLHGMTAHEVALDEVWATDPIRGQELLAAVSPTLATNPGAQLIITSTAGTAESTWFHSYVDKGRQLAPAITYLEWSAPDGTKDDDLDAIAEAHPAVPQLISRDFLATQHEIMADTPQEFLRAFGNVRTQALERVIPRALWDAAVTTDAPAGRICIAADISADRSQADIVACSGGILEVVESRKGHAWVAKRLVDLVERHKPAAVCVDNIGPSAALHDELSRAGITLLPLSGREMATACESFLSDLSTGALRHRRHPQLDAAVDNAATRPLGDGFAWSRRRASAPISALVAATLASYADQHRPPAAVRPLAAAG